MSTYTSMRNKRLAHLQNAPGIQSRSAKTRRSRSTPTGTECIQENYTDCIQIPEIEVTTKSPLTPVVVPQVLKHSKACFFSPECQDFGQHTVDGVLLTHNNQRQNNRTEYERMILDQYKLALSRSSLSLNTGDCLKKEGSSQCFKHFLTPTKEESMSDTMDDLNKWDLPPDCVLAPENDTLKQCTGDGKQSKGVGISLTPERQERSTLAPTGIHINKVPRVKVIAKIYSKITNNHIEVRKLEEKIVCLEYDVYDKGYWCYTKEPMQTMRAYFSVSTGCDKCSDQCTLLNELPSALKEKLGVDAKNISNMKEKEIEIINETTQETKSYLNDLRRFLQKKEALYAKKKKSSLDLNYLYDMARMETPPVDYGFSKTQLLSEKELQEIKQLILENCDSETGAFSRKTIKGWMKSSRDISEKPKSRDETIIYELLMALQQQ